MNAIAGYLRDHQSRLAAQENRMAEHEERLRGLGERIEWAEGAINHILNSRVWRLVGFAGRVSRALFGRDSSGHLKRLQ
jgi:hypothetical protein